MTAAVPETAPVQLLLADGAASRRARLRVALEGRGFVVADEVSDAASAAAAALRRRPDVCLLDLDLPGDPIGAVARMVSELPGVAVVCLATRRDDERLLEALRAGACGYIVRDVEAARLPLALLGVLVGDPALPRALAERVIDEFRELGPRRRLPPGVELTNREWKILGLLGQGLTTAEVANRLFISPSTVRCHVAAILKKLHVPDRKAA
ncbi:MAG: response regulator transcription factor, partial [Actinomycetota bacterium]|nr:response regulator transcription factor [Actinomycetota bacterium]